MIKEVWVRRVCPICNGRENGCYDCSGKGYFEEWVSLRELLDSLDDLVKEMKAFNCVI